MSAYGLYVRNVRGITLQNVRFQVSTPDLCPDVILDHAEDVAIYGLSVQGNLEAESLLRFIDFKQTLLTGTRVLTPFSTFLQLEGRPTTATSWKVATYPKGLRPSRTRTAQPKEP